MKVIVTTQEELKEIINDAVERTFKQLMPKAIRMAKEKEWLTIDEVMERLTCSRRHIQYLRDNPRITFYPEGRAIRYQVTDIREFMKRNKV